MQQRGTAKHLVSGLCRPARDPHFSRMRGDPCRAWRSRTPGMSERRPGDAAASRVWTISIWPVTDRQPDIGSDLQKRCRNYNEWTFGDGFQTLAKRSKPLRHKGSRPVAATRRVPNPGPKRPARAVIGSRRKKRDGFQTPSSDASPPPTPPPSSPPTGQGQRSRNLPSGTGSIVPPPPRPTSTPRDSHSPPSGPDTASTHRPSPTDSAGPGYRFAPAEDGHPNTRGR